MYELKTNTATRIAVGPLVDPTDGKTAETALTVTGLTVDILKMDATGGGAVTRTSFSPTASGGSNDMIHITSDAVGMYDLELTATQLNFLGPARLVFYDVDGFLVHWIDILVVSAAFFSWKYGSTIPNVNVTQISGDSTAADNCESMFDGTGYAGGTAKLKVDVDTIKTQAVTCAAGVTVLASVGTAATSTAQTGDAYSIVNNGTYGNSAIKTQLADIHDTDLPAVKTDTGNIVTKTNSLTFTVAGKVDSNVYTWNGTAVATPATAGVPDVNVKNVNNVSSSSVTAVNANIGTTQPINFTGTGASAYAKTDMVDISGAAVSTSTAQIGVNAVQIGASVPGSATIGTVTNLTNAPTAGDLTATMKTSVQTACDAALVAENLDHLCKTATAGVDMTTEVTDGSIISRIISNSDTSLFVPATSNLTTLKSVVDNLHDTDIPDIHTDVGTVLTNLATVDSIIDNIHDTDLPAVKSDTAAILADTGTDGVVVASGSKTGYALTSAEHTNVADALLNRDMSAVTVTNARSPINALRFLRNKWTITGTTLSVKKEDDSTEAWTATLSQDETALPITGSDPS